MFRQRFMFPGPSCAAVLASGITSFFIGLITTLLVFTQGIGTEIDWVFEEFSAIVVFLGILIWLLSWYYLRSAWKNAIIRRNEVYKISVLLASLGIAGTLFSATIFLMQAS